MRLADCVARDYLEFEVVRRAVDAPFASILPVYARCAAEVAGDPVFAVFKRNFAKFNEKYPVDVCDLHVFAVVVSDVWSDSDLPRIRSRVAASFAIAPKSVDALAAFVVKVSKDFQASKTKVARTVSAIQRAVVRFEIRDAADVATSHARFHSLAPQRLRDVVCVLDHVAPGVALPKQLAIFRNGVRVTIAAFFDVVLSRLPPSLPGCTFEREFAEVVWNDADRPALREALVFSVRGWETVWRAERWDTKKRTRFGLARWARDSRVDWLGLRDDLVTWALRDAR